MPSVVAVASAPGQWRKLAQPAGAGAYHRYCRFFISEAHGQVDPDVVGSEDQRWDALHLVPFRAHAADIFFHRTPIKVLIEPVSGALLHVLRWPWHTAEDRALMLEPWKALRLLVSDLGTDLVGAAGRVPTRDSASTSPTIAGPGTRCCSKR